MELLPLLYLFDGVSSTLKILYTLYKVFTDLDFPDCYPNTFFSGHIMYKSSINSQVSSYHLLNDRPNRWDGQCGTEEWMGGTLSSKYIQSRCSWGLSEGNKRNINPNGEGGGC